jgi:hypothetical protein
MQRRHFEAIADIIREIAEESDTDEAKFQRDRVARHFASRLRRTNSNFNKERFLRACGVPE